MRAAASQLTREQLLERQADQLLWADCRPHELEYSFYSASRTALQGRRQEIQLPPVQPPARSAASLVLDEILEAGVLNQHQRLVLELLRRGLQEAQIAKLIGTSPRTIRRLRRQAVEMLRMWLHGSDQAGSEGRETQIRQAMAEQRRLNVPDAINHCRPGHEACRDTGLCKFRWYLYYEG